MKPYNPIEDLNRENERAFWLPLILPFIIPFLIIMAIPLVIHFADVIDAYASKHPLQVAGVCFLVSGIGWYLLGRYNRMW